MVTILPALRQVREDLGELLDRTAVEKVCRELGHEWRDGPLDPYATLHLFILQVLHQNTAMTHLPHLAGEPFSASAYCQARQRLPVALNPRGLVEFDAFVGTTELFLDHSGGMGVCAGRDLDSSQPFWARLLVVCYQGGDTEDVDPDAYENCDAGGPGYVSPVNCATPNYPTLALSDLNATAAGATKFGISIRNGASSMATSTVYKEALRDEQPMQTGRFWQYVAHEIGHATVPDQGETAEHSEGFLMTEGVNIQDHPLFHVFAAETLARFRAAQRW